MIISRRRNIYTICFIAVIFTCAASYRLPGMAAMAASDTSKLTGQSQAGDDDVFFETLFKQYPGVFDSVLAHRRDWNVQIIYTEVNRNNNNIPTTKSYYFNRAGARYFYPASSIKLPVALLALQRLQELKASGIDKFSTMITEPVGPGLSGVYNEPNSTDGIPNIAKKNKKILFKVKRIKIAFCSHKNFYKLHLNYHSDFINESLLPEICCLNFQPLCKNSK